MAIFVLIIGGGMILLTVYVSVFLRELVNGDDLKLIIILIGVIPFLGCCSLAYSLSNKKLKVYQNGFIYQQKKNKSIVFWQDIASYHECIDWYLLNGIPFGRGVIITITTYSDEQFVLGQEIAGLSKIQSFIEKNISEFA